jgi:hypothetical protein
MLELVAFQEKVLVFVSGSAQIGSAGRHWQSQSFVVRPIAHGHYPPRETMAIPKYLIIIDVPPTIRLENKSNIQKGFRQ